MMTRMKMTQIVRPLIKLTWFNCIMHVSLIHWEFLEGPTRRKMARNVKASPMKGKPGRRKTIDNLNESINSSASTETGKTKRTSQAKCADLNIYLEDYFDAICSYQDGTQRYIANVFYLLPTAKVNYQKLIITCLFNCLYYILCYFSRIIRTIMKQ